VAVRFAAALDLVRRTERDRFPEDWTPEDIGELLREISQSHAARMAKRPKGQRDRASRLQALRAQGDMVTRLVASIYALAPDGPERQRWIEAQVQIIWVEIMGQPQARLSFIRRVLHRSRSHRSRALQLVYAAVEDPGDLDPEDLRRELARVTISSAW
jgi:hypothetical protein